MKLRDYKTLLTTDPRAAMLFDLTERFPRGPNAKLRAPDYKRDGEVLSDGWGSNEAPYLAHGVDSANGSTKTGGWDPYVIYELPDNEWNLQHLLQQIEVAEEMAMGSGYWCDEGVSKLFKTGAQLTRRARRAANRIRRAKEWVKENIGTAVYEVNFGYYSRGNGVYVHADSEDGAMKQFELFMKGGFNKHCPNYDEEHIRVSYVRPAKTPLELMALNQPFIDQYTAAIAKKRQMIEQLQQEIEAMDTAHQVVNIYAINMVATWGTGEGENENA